MRKFKFNNKMKLYIGLIIVMVILVAAYPSISSVGQFISRENKVLPIQPISTAVANATIPNDLYVTGNITAEYYYGIPGPVGGQGRFRSLLISNDYPTIIPNVPFAGAWVQGDIYSNGEKIHQQYGNGYAAVRNSPNATPIVTDGTVINAAQGVVLYPDGTFGGELRVYCSLPGSIAISGGCACGVSGLNDTTVNNVNNHVTVNMPLNNEIYGWYLKNGSPYTGWLCGCRYNSYIRTDIQCAY